MKKPIFLYGSIDAIKSERYSVELLELPDNEDSETWINSGGGSVFDGYAMLTALAKRKQMYPNTKNNALVTGDASSMAFNMLLFMDNVEAVETANITIHRADTWVFDERQQDWLNKKNKELRQKLENKVNEELFVKITGTSYDEIFDPEKRLNLTITAKQAKKLGIVQKIINLETTKQLEAQYSNVLAAFHNTGINNLNSINMKKTIKRELTAAERFKGVAEFEIDIEADNNNQKIEAEAKNAEKLEAFQTAILEANIAIQDETKQLKTKLEASEQKYLKLDERFKKLEAALNEAKLMKSDPELPNAEFRQEEIQKSYTSQDLTAAIDAALIADRKKIIENRSKF